MLHFKLQTAFKLYTKNAAELCVVIESSAARITIIPSVRILAKGGEGDKDGEGSGRPAMKRVQLAGNVI